jgi:RND family efflux transporter MFP subunit
MKTTTLPTLGAGFLLLGAAIAIAAWPDDAAAPVVARSQATAVEVVAVAPGDATRRVVLTGVVRPADRAELSFAVPGRLERRPVEVGDRVTAGRVLASLDRRQAELASRAAASALEETEARLAQAGNDLARVRRLAAVDAATAEEVERVETAYRVLAAGRQAAAAGLDEARRQLAETELVAPFAGVVTAVGLEPGEWAAPGAAVVEVAGGDNLEVEVAAPETVLAALELGAAVTVHLPLAGVAVGGRIASFAAAARAGDGLFPLVVELDPAPGVVAGAAAEAVLDRSAAGGLAVPVEAVLNPGSSRPSVFAVRDGVAHRVDVRLGDLAGDRVMVAADLAVGDEVVVSGHTQLADLDRVEVRR